jgi:Domain of unknown function (DUF4260)
MTAAPTTEGIVTGAPRIWLRAEALAVLALSLVLYALLSNHWGIFAALFLVPDLAMLGYVLNPRIGAATYNTVHSYLAPVALAAFATTTHRETLLPYVCIWTAHIALDRALGYGQKYPDAFRHTHLGYLGKRES